jgi:hypothetical protein
MKKRYHPNNWWNALSYKTKREIADLFWTKLFSREDEERYFLAKLECDMINGKKNSHPKQ